MLKVQALLTLCMNPAHNPRPPTLPQVTFAVCPGMVTCPYFSILKGWLHSWLPSVASHFGCAQRMNVERLNP